MNVFVEKQIRECSSYHFTEVVNLIMFPSQVFHCTFDYLSFTLMSENLKVIYNSGFICVIYVS